MQAVILTGGTGITSRDSTYEAVEALLDKRLPGFGELFRVLSYQEVGAAAMLSRAQMGIHARRIVVSLAGIAQRLPARAREAAAARAAPPRARGESVIVGGAILVWRTRRSGCLARVAASRSRSSCTLVLAVLVGRQPPGRRT